VAKHGRVIDVVRPERRFFIASQTPTTQVALRRRLNEDLYINFAGAGEGSKVVLQAYIFPLVSWIWIGFAVVLFGTLVCLIPSKQKLVFPRTEVVGIGQPQKVQS
jgi:cytochrome c-type biogenesis protein CcmF